MWNNAKYRAKKKNLPFNLDPEDIVFPERCPVFGYKLQFCRGEKGGGATSPSLDRIVPSLGYVKGNVRVISARANTLKWNYTPAELVALARYILRQESHENS